MRWSVMVPTAAIGLAIGAAASADMVIPAAGPCPMGSISDSDHCDNDRCTPVDCTTDEDCVGLSPLGQRERPQHVCREIGLCVETTAGDGCRSGLAIYRVARGYCASKSDCVAPARCSVGRRCIAIAKLRERLGAPGDTGARCTFAAPNRAGDGCPLALWLVVLGLAWRRLARPRPVTSARS